MPEEKVACVETLVMKSKAAVTDAQPAQMKEEMVKVVRAGQPAPDFQASGYVNGGFKNVSLSDYKGKWVVLCFYPGDFTFV